MKKYYALTQTGSAADIHIYGDITSWPWLESDVSSYILSKELEQIDAESINVYINSYGGEVAEGLAIYNALKRHKAKITTYCDGFACSIASVIFMAGSERIIYNTSLLMIHNAWTRARGNSAELRKTADDLDIISQAAVEAYISGVSIDREELQQLLDCESWLSAQTAFDKGFATTIVNPGESDKPSQSARAYLYQLIANQANKTDPPDFLNKKMQVPAEPAPSKAFKLYSAFTRGKE